MNERKTKIIFVCTGNTCRSPMAEILLKAELKTRGLKDITVSSAGISPKKGDTTNPKTLQVLEEHGFLAVAKTARRLTDRMMKDAYAIVCMTEKQRDYLLDARWQAMRKAGEENFDNNVYSFSELTGYDIVDPYGRDLDAYRYVFELFVGGMSALIEKLKIESVATPCKKRGRKKKENN